MLEWQVAILNRTVRVDLIEKMRFKQTNEGCEDVNYRYLEKNLQAKRTAKAKQSLKV